MKKLLALALAIATAPLAAQEAPGEERTTPLFVADDRLDLTLAGPIGQIIRKAARSTDAVSAQLQANGETHEIELSARGKSRRKRDVCRFPPLRIRFSDKPAGQSLFARQGSLKLVTHCQSRDSYDQYVLREYAVYRLYNVITPESLKVRLAQVTYIDDGKTIASRPAFLIEDADDAARRLGGKEVDSGDLPLNALNYVDAARYALFQYLVGNTDWGMVVGPNPADCCHNSKLLGASKDARRDLTPLPYDFDNAGLVDAPYAVPNEVLGTRSVRTRVYRGFCAFNDLVPAEAKRLEELRPALEREIRSIPGLEPKTQSAMLDYLASGFADFADDQAIERNLLRKCR